MRNELPFAAALGLGLCASGVALAGSYGQPSPFTLPGTQEFQSSKEALMGKAQKSVPVPGLKQERASTSTLGTNGSPTA